MFGGRERTGFFSLFKNNPYVPKTLQNVLNCKSSNFLYLLVYREWILLHLGSMMVYRISYVVEKCQVRWGTDVFSWKGNSTLATFSQYFFLQ